MKNSIDSKEFEQLFNKLLKGEALPDAFYCEFTDENLPQFIVDSSISDLEE